jgi:hypothetical protein
MLRSPEDLFRIMTQRVEFHNSFINWIEMEDGSGYSFNVTLANGKRLYIRFPKPEPVRITELN